MGSTILIDGANNVISVSADGAVDLGDATNRYKTLFVDTLGDGAAAVVLGGTALTLADNKSITLGTGADATLLFDAANTVLATAGAAIFQTNGTAPDAFEP